jgi:methylamine utilization protein MauJ
MEVIYRLPVNPQTELSVQDGTLPIEINGATVIWEVTEEGNLAAIELRIAHQPIKYDERGVILSTHPELDALAYRLNSYIANSVFKQTALDAIDPETVVGKTPELQAETAEEEAILTERMRTVGTSQRFAWRVEGNFNPQEYPQLYEHSRAVALYADALRVKSPFQKYELFYKVIEYFFPKQGKSFDKAVSAYAHPFDNRFNESQITALRELRVRSMHPHPRRGQHANPEDLQAVREVKGHVHLVQELANLLLEHPTF